MAGDYEPFLINPPKRAPKHRRRIKYRANDYSPGMEIASPDEMGIGIRSGHVEMHKRKSAKVKRKRKAVERRKSVAKAKRKKATKKGSARKKGSPAAKAWGRKMARLRAAGGKKHKVAKRRKVAKRHKKHISAWTAAGRTRVPSVTRRKRRKVTVAKRRRATGKRHTIAAYMSKGIMRTGPRKHKYGVKSGFRINPFRSMHRNPFGEELMVIGANPRRKRRRKSTMSNPKHRRVGVRKMAKRHRVHKNPMSALTGLIPTLAWATGGAFAADMTPKLIFKYMPTIAGPWAGYGIKAGVIAGGGYLIDKQFGKNAGESFIIGAVAASVATILTDLTSGFFAGLGLGELGDGMSAFPDHSNLSALPENYADYGDGDIVDAYAIDGY